MPLVRVRHGHEVEPGNTNTALRNTPSSAVRARQLATCRAPYICYQVHGTQHEQYLNFNQQSESFDVTFIARISRFPCLCHRQYMTPAINQTHRLPSRISSCSQHESNSWCKCRTLRCLGAREIRLENAAEAVPHLCNASLRASSSFSCVFRCSPRARRTAS